MNCLTACAASTQAIGEATEILRRGDADVMIGGGAHSMIHPFGVTGFNRLTALSTSNENPTCASRPFDMHRGGFVLGEGAGMVILETLEHAQARGAKILAEVVGYGSTADAFRITDQDPEGMGQLRVVAMPEALADAKLKPTDVNYINAHGTGQRENDGNETTAIKKVFGENAKNVPVSSIKSMMGHLIAAAGSVEMIWLRAGDSRSDLAADDELRGVRSRVRSGLRAEQGGRRRWMGRRRTALASAGRTTRLP